MSVTTTATPKHVFHHEQWYKDLGNFAKPHFGKSVWQLGNTLIPYFALWGVMITMLQRGVNYGYVLLVALPTAGLAVRIFIIFHDCGHGSFFKSLTANKFWGYFMGTLVFTPYEDWRHPHAVHHATTGDLDRRDTGEIWTLTVEEFENAPPRKRLLYRVYRSPFGILIAGPVGLFLFAQRIPHKSSGWREKKSVHITNFWLAVIVATAYFTIGIKTYLMIQLPVMIMAGTAGVWLFYVQHQFEPTFWTRHEHWGPVQAALQGSSYYKLPKIVQWFTGNIGLHHIHHLRPRIPNYNLQACYDTIPEMQQVEVLTFKKSLHCMWLNLWDEPNKRLISFRELKRRPVVQRHNQAA